MNTNIASTSLNRLDGADTDFYAGNLMTEEDGSLIELTTMVVSAYVAHNTVARAELAGLIVNTSSAFARLGVPLESATASVALVPAVPIKKSVTPDAIICLEDGKAFKSLRRQLGTPYNLTPEQYREKWGLPSDYPMVAPTYSEARSALAKASGLGRKAKLARAASPLLNPTRAKPGRPRKQPVS